MSQGLASRKQKGSKRGHALAPRPKPANSRPRVARFFTLVYIDIGMSMRRFAAFGLSWQKEKFVIALR
jgi:hypothetical protein